MLKCSRAALTSLRNLAVFRQGTVGLASGPTGPDGSLEPKPIHGRPEETKEHYEPLVGDQVEDYREYYKHHKASPLSEIKLVDTRKPIRRATDDTADSMDPFDVYEIGWLPEQLDTAEEALERARRIWQENAMRGDPNSPHGRVLRVLRGEWF